MQMTNALVKTQHESALCAISDLSSKF